MFSKAKYIPLIFVLLVFSAAFVFAGPLEDCKEYAKLGVPGYDGKFLCRTGHLLSHSPEYKTPFWVIEHLTAEKASAKEFERDKFRPDPDLQKGERAELADYKGSGYDRGHMAPAADMKWDQQAMIECFYLSNMVPQNPPMNQIIWRILEENVRNWAIDRGELYIFTGPIYEGRTKKTIGKNKVAVPTHLYKIIYDPKKNEAIAFIMPNVKLNTEDMPTYIVTIREIEEKTGLDFLSELEKGLQDTIETAKAKDLWQ
ncbi:MAG: DNA/RNA non-specific endonuclease [Syntrophorhabdaceae bacterium]|nr:DNA/RNA non-specific endonuclease [Syntrophorhabdaceae bacterium]